MRTSSKSIFHVYVISGTPDREIGEFTVTSDIEGLVLEFQNSKLGKVFDEIEHLVPRLLKANHGIEDKDMDLVQIFISFHEENLVSLYSRGKGKTPRIYRPILEGEIGEGA
ncbi:MAG: hypothetical protein OXF23_04255 [Candidatus Dadabacteria bacterium]|nr:hypothetical protein [Candidatus Dadabacteria bacterium]